MSASQRLHWARWVVAVPLLGVLAGHGALSGQEGSSTLLGTVRAEESGAPLAGARVVLADAGREEETDEEGRFRFYRVDAGPHTVEVRYLGRRSTRITVELEAGFVTRVELSLPAEAVELPELRVDVRRRWRGKLAGFYKRRQMGVGHFRTRAEIARSAGTLFHQVFRGIPGLRVLQCGPTCRKLQSDRALPSFVIRRKKCAPTYYMDGARVPLNEFPLGVNEVEKEEVEAVEVYTGPSQIPVQYGGSNSACGVVLIWTRER